MSIQSAWLFQKLGKLWNDILARIIGLLSNTTISGCHIGFCFGLLASLSCKHGRHLRRANWLLLTDRLVVIGCLVINVMLIDTYEVFSCLFCLSCLVYSWRKKTSGSRVHGASFDCLIGSMDCLLECSYHL